MKLRWLSVADIHLKLTDPLGKIENRLNTRLNDKLNSIVQSVDFALEKEVDFVVFLGDIFHTFNPHEKLRELFIQTIQKLVQQGIPIMWVVGNHETDMQSFNFAAAGRLLNLTSNNNKFLIISQHISMEKYGYTFSFIPATYTDEQIVKELEKVKSNKTLVFGHWGTCEAEIGENEFRYRNGISSTHYKGFRQIYLGDFHKYQKYDNWMYVGSLNKQTFAELSDVKGFVYTQLDTDTDELINEFIPVRDRLFIEIVYNELDTEFINPLTTPGILNSVIKLQFKGTKTWFYGLSRNQIIYNYYKAGAHKVFTDYTNQENHQESQSTVTVGSDYKDDIKEFFTKNNRLDLINISTKFLYNQTG